MDVVILGAGVVGLTLANLLAQNNALKITLIEAKPLDFSWDTVDYDLRCSAITHASQNVFKHLGIWEQIIAERSGVYDRMQVWSHQDNSVLNFSASDVSATELGHIIENRVLQRALWDKVKGSSNVNIVYGETTKIEASKDTNHLYLADLCIHSKLIIGADGANSWLRRVARLGEYTWDYTQTALVATIRSKLPHHRTARQCFTLDGPLAFLPLEDSNLCSIVWSANPEKIAHLMQCNEQEFCRLLAVDFEHKLGVLELCGKRACFPLRMLHAKKYIAERIVLIGDAVHVVHPLAGQGMNLGIMDAAALAEVINQACIDNKDIGKTAVLRKYERWRKGHNLSVIAITDAIKRGFEIQNSLFQYLRGYGMRLTNEFGFGRQLMISIAMGLVGDLPLIAKS